MICQGETIQLTDQSYNAPVLSRQWTVSDGTASSLTTATPTVTFNTPGYKTIRLVVSNATGTDTLEMYNYIYVSPQWADFTGPASIDFENEVANNFIVDNPEFNNGNFEL
jgi:PKD repeat protein